MPRQKLQFALSAVDFYHGEKFSFLKNLCDPSASILITDENVFAAHGKKFRGWNTIVLKAGEKYKVQATVDSVIEQLVDFGCDRSYTIVGVGGGVVTDITGYVASIYMRGIRFGLVPTSLLCMVDASIGGKNGVDLGPYKNMVGTIRQPAFILHDISFLSSLPEEEWANGFAEIIKHAAIRDASLFRMLENNDLRYYGKNKAALAEMVKRNVLLKWKVVRADEMETGERKLLNFGHTLGHAIENQYRMPHGRAISIGMSFASRLSAELTGFTEEGRVINLLEQYGLPFHFNYNRDKVISVLNMDKKKNRNGVNFILLQKIGKAIIQPVSFETIYGAL